MPKRHPGFVSVAAAPLLAAALLLNTDVARAAPDPTYTSLREARVQGPGTAVQNLVLERDVFRFHFEKGVFQFLAPVDGRVTAAVFIGEGSWELHPASEAERRQLALVTAEKTLEVLTDRFTELVLLFTDDTALEIRERGTPSAGAVPGAADAWDAFRKRERKGFKTNLQLRVLGDLLRPPDPANGLFLAYAKGRKLSPCLAIVDPRGLQWLSAGFDTGLEQSALYALDDTKGGLWYLSRRIDAKATAPRRLTRADRYEIDTAILKDSSIRGATTIHFESLEEGTRVLPIALLDRLRIQEAAFAPEDAETWTPAAFIQEAKEEDADAAVVFPAALAAGQAVRLRLRYEGTDVLASAGDGNYVVGARESWYPNLGVFREPAAYELTYRIPSKNEIVSVGDPVETRAEGDTTVAVWKTSTPIRVAGFNYGRRFKKLEQADPDSGLRIQVFTNPGTPDIIREIELSGVSPEKLADSAMADGINTARVGSIYFGPLPYGHVAITQQSQWFFGQSWPTLIFLPYLSFLDSYNRFRLGLHGTEGFVDAVGPHEFSHQWWGHLVGWDTYHDQWLSEGFAEFTAALVLEITVGPKKAADYWDKARKDILEKPALASVANDEAGPITQGWRLATWRNRSAAQAMIYLKGAYVLQMLRMLMRDPKARPADAAFAAMMKDFVSSHYARNPSTRDFQTVVERHMSPVMDLTHDGKMDWFFRQWVEGTEIPKYVVKVDVQSVGDDQYKFTGSVAQEGVSDEFRGFLPLYIEFGKGELVRFGVVSFTGKQTVPVDATVKLPKKPSRIVGNALHDVLVRE